MPSKGDTANIFAVCALPVFLWAIYSYLYAFPGYVLRLNAWDLIGALSYTLAFALLESAITTLPFVIASVLLPPRIFKNNIVVLTTVIVLVTSIWMIDANYHQVNFGEYEIGRFILYVTLYLLTVAVPITIVIRFDRIGRIIQGFVGRLALLVYVYAALAAIAVLIVLLRNF